MQRQPDWTTTMKTMVRITVYSIGAISGLGSYAKTTEGCSGTGLETGGGGGM